MQNETHNEIVSKKYPTKRRRNRKLTQSKKNSYC